jgi:bifunctional DNA-binding transcriptional regulator/antitoxin component of YhaV-PrlF toxin-antitoxin module
MLVQTDTRRRITLPPNAGVKPGDALNLEILEDGRIVLVPVEPVPRHQLWAWTAEAKQSIVTSLTDPRPAIVVESPAQASAVADRWSYED